MEHWFESSLEDLYHSAVKAFPNTKKRQHATHPIEIEHVKWVPYVGMKTLLVKAEAKNEDRHYNTMIVFKNVAYHDQNTKGLIPLTVNGKEYFLEQMSLDNDVLVRCNCNDFRFRFNYYDHLDRSLYGRKAAKYESLGIGPPANPKELPGMCKHLMKLKEMLNKFGILLAE